MTNGERLDEIVHAAAAQGQAPGCGGRGGSRRHDVHQEQRPTCSRSPDISSLSFRDSRFGRTQLRHASRMARAWASREEMSSQPQSSYPFLMRRIRSCHEPKGISSTKPFGFFESLASTNDSLALISTHSLWSALALLFRHVAGAGYLSGRVGIQRSSVRRAPRRFAATQARRRTRTNQQGAHANHL